MAEIEKELADLKEKTNDIELKWRNEKEALGIIKTIKEEMDRLRAEAEQAEAMADLSQAAEIRYVLLPQLEKELETQNKRLRSLQKNRRFVNEEITEEQIALVVGRWTGVPVTKMLTEEAEKLEGMEEFLKSEIVGQNDPIAKITDAVKRSRVGIADPNRPIGSFMLLGPTGVGKTELTKKLAEFMFDNDEALIRVDMSEFMEAHSVSKLIGSPPGYVGHDEAGGLTEKVRHRPYAVVLFDEIEKAHPEVFNILLQVLDNGQLTDGKGRTVNFRNTIVVLTSNVGADYIGKMESIGFRRDEDQAEGDYSEAKDRVMESLKDSFRPEFLNRLDEIIVFDTLTRETLEKIVHIQLAIVEKRLAEKNVKLKISKKAITALIEKGYTPEYGARPLKRSIQTNVLNPLASAMIKHKNSSGTFAVDVKDDEFVYEYKAKGKRKMEKKEEKEKVVV